MAELRERTVGRALRVPKQPLAARDAEAASRPFETPLLVAAARCTLRYVVLPFMLPLLGIAAGAALGILLVLDVIAAVAIVTTLRTLWRRRHPRRWLYALAALALGVLVGLFFANDARVLLT